MISHRDELQEAKRLLRLAQTMHNIPTYWLKQVDNFLNPQKINVPLSEQISQIDGTLARLERMITTNGEQMNNLRNQVTLQDERIEEVNKRIGNFHFNTSHNS